MDGETFERIEAQDVERWLEKLREELVAGTYAPKPLLRVWIPKSNGGQRPLGIPSIRDRVVQMAVVLVARSHLRGGPAATAVRVSSGVDAKMALRRVYLACDAARETGGGGRGSARLLHFDSACSLDAVVWSRRIADGRVLKTIKRWLTAPVVENASTVDGFRPPKRAGRSGERRRAE